MVQGKTKGLQNKGTSTRKDRQTANLTKGRKVIAPKKAGLIKHDQMKKTLSAKINRSVEGQMVAAASSGKLTIMRNLIR
ncbi:hypothetical protein FA15DRAFT_107304 [Coprinopsis marcescibilis]|uniref:Uncharacterized protein n=1 Tax=Coprinopsis marcescibilis TaxID=230819 RepID=A0A5C3L7G3_COPMA|nr:hypothetical protein FA15DRAFT_107304 [Coprinopsis marcescibilis]